MRCKKLKSFPEIKNITRKLRSGKRKVVFTNGCFEILHAGHVSYLEKAKAMGDILVVGLNSDSSVGRLKGPSRPVTRQGDRARVLSSLSCVDFVVVFQSDTPLDLIKAVKPDVLVKGGDWKKKDIVGSDFVASYGGAVKSLPYLKGYSTTEIIRKINRLA